VQGKTKLETNQLAASILPHYNTFEARALRVVISDLPPEFPDTSFVECKCLPLVDCDGHRKDFQCTVGSACKPSCFADVKLPMKRFVELLREAQHCRTSVVLLRANERLPNHGKGEFAVTFIDPTCEHICDPPPTLDLRKQYYVRLTLSDMLHCIRALPEGERPPDYQLVRNNGSGTLIGEFVYNSVLTFYVGEKIMIQTPTWFFPAGAGPYSEESHITHGEPSPMATFRFAEPIHIDKQQNFRVDIEIPDSDTLKELQRTYGPLFIWTVIDGYMTRDVQ
jgi:hypothetical protein